MRFACVGDNCIDRYLPPVNARFAGGNAVNVAVQLKRLGHNTSYFGAIGNDEDGRFLRARLEHQGLDLAGLCVREGLPTAYTDIATDEAGERHIAFEEFGATKGYRPSTDDMTRLLTMEHVHIGWFDDGGALKRRLRAAGIPVSQDLSVNAQPENLDPADLTYALASSSRAGAEALARQLLREGARCAVITMGEEGSLALRGTEFLILPAEPIAVIDTTGAGDSFIAGFLSVAAAGGELDRALAAGRNSASQACLHQGGFPQ